MLKNLFETLKTSSWTLSLLQFFLNQCHPNLPPANIGTYISWSMTSKPNRSGHPTIENNDQIVHHGDMAVAGGSWRMK